MSESESETHRERVLVVDDDPDQRWLVENYLGERGFVVHTAADGAEMRRQISENTYDLIVMDVNLPGEDGFSLTRSLSENLDVGIIMVTAANDLADRVLGLEFGADDYLAKPFEPREMLARIKSILRRRSTPNLADGRASGLNDDKAVYGFDQYQLDTRQFLVSRNGEPCFMEPKCIDLLTLLIENRERVVSREEVLASVWAGRIVSDSAVNTLIKQLRKAIGDNGKDQRLIRTVHGRGFQFVGNLIVE